LGGKEMYCAEGIISWTKALSDYSGRPYKFELPCRSKLTEMSMVAHNLMSYAFKSTGSASKAEIDPKSLSARFKKAVIDTPLHQWSLHNSRNHHQPHFDKLETALKTVIDTYGEDKAIELLPSRITDSFCHEDNFRDNMKELQFKTTLLSSNTVDNLLQKAQIKLMQNKQKPENTL
jgi:hypothetical protein